MFSGTDKKEYSAFEFQWLDVVLGQPGILLPGDVRALAKQFNISFVRPIETIDPVEVGHVLTADIPRNELLPAVQSLIGNEYTNMLSFGEAERAYDRLRHYSEKALLALLKKLPINARAYTPAKPKSGDFVGVLAPPRETLLHLAVEGLCRLPRDYALSIL